ncbi:MAG: 2-C-methyl-D-erythritol 2,4-cyclodiphosphate synthase [bacterium]
MRSGIGFDVHCLVKGRKLILGGMDIPFDKGLLGHSDADVLSHAIGDALLGGAGLGDLGRHFPDTSDKWKDICSLNILMNIKNMINEKFLHIHYIDSIVIAQSPKIAPYIEMMRKNIAEALEMEIESVSIKATTTEKLGITGRGEGIASQAVATLTREA